MATERRTGRSTEPLFWSLFSGGGTIAALIAPVLIVVVGFLVPAKLLRFDRIADIVTHPAGRVILFIVALLFFFHAAHRIRHTLVDVGLRRYALAIAVGCYAAALAGSAWAGVVLFS